MAPCRPPLSSLCGPMCKGRGLFCVCYVALNKAQPLTTNHHQHHHQVSPASLAAGLCSGVVHDAVCTNDACHGTGRVGHAPATVCVCLPLTHTVAPFYVQMDGLNLSDPNVVKNFAAEVWVSSHPQPCCSLSSLLRSHSPSLVPSFLTTSGQPAMPPLSPLWALRGCCSSSCCCDTPVSA